MWAARHRFILGLLLTLGGFFVGFWVAELLDGHVGLRRGTIGFLAAGVAMCAGDLTLRHF